MNDMGEILRDLSRKAASDAMRAVNTTMDLAAEEAGQAGMFLLAQKLSMCFTLGAAMTLCYMRTEEIEERPKDDILFVGLLNAALEYKERDEAVDLAQEWYSKIKGHRHGLPGGMRNA